MKNTVLFCLALVLVGCAATLHDVQQSPPMLTITSDLPAKTLANKIAYESAQESLKSRMFPDWDPAKIIELGNGVHKAIVTVTYRGNILLIPFPVAIAEMTITPTESGGSFLEYRGVPWTSQEKFVVMLKHCASPQNSPGK